MKVKVLKSFRDISDYAYSYSPGCIIDVDPDRAQRLVKFGLAELVESESECEQPKPKKNKA